MAENDAKATKAGPKEFRNWIKADGSTDFLPEADRYHLFVSLACPYAHRALIARKLKGLERVIPITIVDWLLDYEKGWSFTDAKAKCSLEPYYGFTHLRQFYLKTASGFAGRVTVPVLWDRKRETICSTESAEIIRMFNSEFNEFSEKPEQRDLDLYPVELREKIDEMNSWMGNTINSGVYKCGFTDAQEQYDVNVKILFESLDKVEGILAKSRYVCGGRLTESDIQLFVTLIRFDHVYHGHFKCNKKRIVDYPNIWAYTRDIYNTMGIGETVDFNHIRRHYMESHVGINPRRIVSVGPDLDFTEPHGRDKI
ncbi:glutathionyl-hydroquinone reductase YqjG-like [Oscarella lobularis]|uniref:glutathionyl-hydroquinone reductase YqjG-like n=1 Tax=Oscarella lobularis TaxID=121494 RepID=UPI003313FB89